MPTAYDLSSVIASGSSVGHNNLIPLGEYPQVWVRGGGCPPGQPGYLGLCITIAVILFLFLGLLAEVSIPLCLAVPPLCPPSLYPGVKSRVGTPTAGRTWAGAGWGR